MSEPVEIEIFGRVFQVKGEKDAQYTRKLASYVDEQMRSIAKRSPPSTSPLQVAILTLLHMANELFEATEGRAEREAAVERKAQTFLERLEASLGKRP